LLGCKLGARHRVFASEFVELGIIPPSSAECIGVHRVVCQDGGIVPSFRRETVSAIRSVVKMMIAQSVPFPAEIVASDLQRARVSVIHLDLDGMRVNAGRSDQMEQGIESAPMGFVQWASPIANE